MLQFETELLIRILKEIGLIRNSYYCCDVQSNVRSRSRLSDGVMFRCPVCKSYKSIRTGSFFEQSRLSLWQIFGLLYLSSDSIIKYKFIKKELNVKAKQSVTDWKNFIRDIYVNYTLNNNTMIGGSGITVQIDESLICKRKYGVGRILANQDMWIVGGVDSEGRIFMEVTVIRNRQTLSEIIRRNVLPGSIIWTDGWPAYRGLENDGYIHDVVIHDNQFVTETGVNTNRIESVWSACKRFYRPITNKRRELVFSYIAEYVFKQKFKSNAFEETINQIKLMYQF